MIARGLDRRTRPAWLAAACALAAVGAWPAATLAQSRVPLVCPGPGQDLVLSTGRYELVGGTCAVDGQLLLLGDADVLVESSDFSVAGDIVLAGNSVFALYDGAFEVTQRTTAQYQIDTRDQARLHLEDCTVTTNGGATGSLTTFLHARGDSRLRFVRCSLDFSHNWLLAFVQDRALVEAEDSVHTPTEIYPRDDSTLRITGPASSHRVVILIAPGQTALFDDLPAGRVFDYTFGRGTPRNDGIGYLVEVINGFTRWGISTGPRADATIRGNMTPVTLSYPFSIVQQPELLSGLHVRGLQNQVLEHQGRRLSLEDVDLFDVAWQIYVKNAAPETVYIDHSIINELGILTDGKVDVTESTFQFAYASAFEPGAVGRIEDSVINSQFVLARANGVLEIVESQIWGGSVEARGTSRLRLLNDAFLPNECHPGCLPACEKSPGGNQCNRFNPAAEVSFKTSGLGAILAAGLEPFVAPVKSGTLLGFVGDLFVESLDPALAGYSYDLSYRPAAGAPVSIVIGAPGPKHGGVLGQLDTTPLAPGDYVVRLELNVPGEPPLVAERPLRIELAPSPKPMLDAVSPTAAASGQTVTLQSADIQASQSYDVSFGLDVQSVVALVAGELSVQVPTDLCASSYPLAFHANGVRSNSIDFEITSSSPGCNFGCIEVVPDERYECTYRSIDHDAHNLLFLRTTDNRHYAGDASDPGSAAVPILDPFIEYGWSATAASVGPNGRNLLAARQRAGCDPVAPGPGLACSYGRPTAWLAHHWEGDPVDPGDDRWVHTNLAPLYGLNSHMLHHSAWLHSRSVLLPLLIRGDGDGWTNAPADFNHQIHELSLGPQGEAVGVAPFAPGQLERAACSTGRVSAVLSGNAFGCTAGQRIAFTRRCFDEPDPDAWSWWNSTQYDSAAGLCVVDAPQFELPVLRSYVMELDSSCVPTKTFEEALPVREPPRDDLHRQMGRASEWGDLSPALSPNGALVAVTTLMGNPRGDSSNSCHGFYYNLADVNDPTSGHAARQIHFCALDPADLTCAGPGDSMWAHGALQAPPEDMIRPGFVMTDDGPALVASRHWGQAGSPELTEVSLLDFLQGPNAFTLLDYGVDAVSCEVIRKGP